MRVFLFGTSVLVGTVCVCVCVCVCLYPPTLQDFSCCCYFFGHFSGKSKTTPRTLYFAVGTTGGQILLFDGVTEVTELINAYAPNEEVCNLKLVAATVAVVVQDWCVLV